MIFYFTGTGNSLMAAKAVAHSDERLVNMAEARKQRSFSFELAENERIGFVFPVYCYTLPDVVLDFVRSLEVKNTGYAFAIITCGGGIGGTGAYLAQELAEKGIVLNYLTPLVMPDDAVFYYDLDPKEKTDTQLAEAEKRLSGICAELNSKKNLKAQGNSSKLFRVMYHAMAKTRQFYVTDACVHCEMCAENCPDGVIKMAHGKPVWIKKSCTKCSACINRCPVSAIQYGKATEKRRRYVNPVLKSEGKN